MSYLPTRIMHILLAIILFFLAVSLWGFYISIRPPKIISTITPRDLGLEYEEVTFITLDNLALKGWFIPQAGNLGAGETPPQNGATKTIILLHGYPADKGNILPALAFLNQNYNLFLFDFRYLGQSGGSYSTAGAKETEDLFAAIRFLRSRYGIGELGVWGFSMGGAVALMAAPKSPEIKVIVAESSYARLDLMAPELYRLPVLKYPLGWLTGLWAKAFLKIDVKNVAPLEAAREINIPVFIIHSTTDKVIPFSHSLLLKESLKHNPHSLFWFQENLQHGELNGEYQKRIGDFFERNL